MKRQTPALPAWMAKPQAYSPASDHDAFIDRSIRSFLRVLSVLRRRPALTQGWRPQPRLALCLVLIVVTMVSLSRNLGFLAIAGACVMLLLCLLPARTIAAVLGNALVAGLFGLLVLLPSLWWGNGFGVLLICLKVLISVALVKILTETQDWSTLAAALTGLRVPGLFILVLDMTLRHLNLLGEFALTMLYALRLRSVGRNGAKSAALSGIAGTLFLKSRQMAGESQAAMECRGFTGEYRAPVGRRLGPADLLFLVSTFGLAGAFFLLP